MQSERQGPENIDCSCIKLLKPHQRRKKAGLISEKSAEESLIPCTGNSFSPTRISDLNIPVPVDCSSQQWKQQKRQIAFAAAIEAVPGISEAFPE